MENNETKDSAPSDFKKNAQNARWCPGCGDHAILNVLHKAMAELGVPPHQTAVISESAAVPAFHTT